MTLSHTPESRQQILEVFDNQFPQRDYVIETICPSSLPFVLKQDSRTLVNWSFVTLLTRSVLS